MNNPVIPKVKTGDLYLYRTATDDQVRVDDQYIESVSVYSVRHILSTIRTSVAAFESVPYGNDSEFMDTIKTCDDVVFKCVSVHRWRKGSGFAFLQISNKNGGSARITVFTTDTVHHSSNCFGSAPPSVSDSKSILKQQIENTTQLVNDIQILKRFHGTTVSASDLAKNIQC